MSKLEELLAANVQATAKLVKAERGLGRDSEAGSIANVPSNRPSQEAAASATNE